MALVNTELKGSLAPGRYVAPKILPKKKPAPPPTPSFSYRPSAYPAVAPALSAAALGAIAERRRLADVGYQQALAKKGRYTGQYNLRAEFDRNEAKADYERLSRDFMRDMDSRGTARFGFSAGRGIRDYTTALTNKYGQIDIDLSDKMLALRDLVEEARLQRDVTLAQIAQEEALLRSTASGFFA